MKYIAFLILLSSVHAHAQKLILKDNTSKRTMKLKIGRTASIISNKDTLDTYFLRYDSITGNRITTQGGHWKLKSIDSKTNSFQMVSVYNGNGALRTFNVDKVDYVICDREEDGRYKLPLFLASVGMLLIAHSEENPARAILYSAGALTLGFVFTTSGWGVDRTWRISGIEK